MKRTLTLIMLAAACGGSSETPVEEITYGDDTVVEGQTDLDKLHALFDAEMAALRAVDADAMLATHVLDADSFMLGPVDVAVMQGGDAISTVVRRVLGGSEPADANATEHVFEVVGSSAFSAHTVVIGPADTPEVTYHSIQVYRNTPDGWRVAASSWTVALPEEQAMQMVAAGAMPESVPIPDHADEGCGTLAEDVAGLRTNTMPPAERIVGSFNLGTAPGEAGPMTQAQYDGIAQAIASDAVQSAAGPGGVYVRKVGDVCFGVTAMDRTFSREGNSMTVHLRAFVVSNPQATNHGAASFSLVLPQRSEEPAAEPPAETADTESAP